MSEWHLIVDFETFSNNSRECAVIDCSVLVFDWERFTSDNPYTTESLSEVKYFKLDVSHQIQDHGFKINQETLDFWEKQSPEVRGRIKPVKGDLKVDEFGFLFSRFLSEKQKYTRWWCRSPAFDQIILERLCEAGNVREKMTSALKHWLIRDTRSYIDGWSGDFSQSNDFIPVSDEAYWETWFKKHDSRYDVVADTLRLQAIARANADLELITR